eukprot:TRINITY_DN6576_c0_g1_i1.p1 TRINITY_DN6576_c0_g1~~TRINITY_DN6576_c0_g1_i1.p1  ORF type:complete len:411 (-),score=95.05 TRINITY_DN6576_c0_g1_i1:172-1329(-)
MSLINIFTGRNKKGKVKLDKLALNRFPLEYFKEEAKQSTTTHISLQDNLIEEIPPRDLYELSISWKFSLQELIISNNSLSSLPREISLLSQLRTLILDNNKIRSLPKDIGKLNCLEEFSICSNKLTELPSEMSEMSALKRLRFSDNRVGRFPRSFGLGLPALKVVTYDRNYIVYPPERVLVLGWASIKSYLAEPLKFIQTRLEKDNFDCALNQRTSKSEERINSELTELSNQVLKLLSNKTTRAAFARFLQREYSLENLLFWEAVDRLHQQEKVLLIEDYQTEAVSIYSRFISSENSEGCEINLPYLLKEKCDALFSRLVWNKPSYNSNTEAQPMPTHQELKNILQEAQNSIFYLLTLDSYQRFLKSEEFQHSGEPLPIRRNWSN